ncbi:MAG: protein phosphatase 2C domain-containing protein [Gemmataceae bacterium]|nr:protein phosphatase 2C domain-containing protein [Gemmataceae bacterium]
MADLVVRVGAFTAQGLRPNNEDSFIADVQHHVYVVADGMGGQERGEQASGLATQIIPRVVQDRLAASDDVSEAVRRALSEANQAIVQAGQSQPVGRRMGTTAVVAVQQNGQVFVAGLGDSRAVLVHADKVEQLTVDHSVAQALVISGVLTPEEARVSPWQHVLHKFLGCAEMTGGAEVRPFTPEAGDRLVMATDGMTNHVFDEDFRRGARACPDPQVWAQHLVQLALSRGSRDNVTCIVVAFDKKG